MSCADVVQRANTAATALSCTMDGSYFNDDCPAGYRDKPNCASQYDGYYRCIIAAPNSGWQCDSVGGWPENKPTTCATEQSALDTCLSN